MRRTTITLAFTLLFGCAAAQNGFAIAGYHIPRNVRDGRTVYLLNHQTMKIIDSTTVVKRAFAFAGRTDSTYMGWITDSREIHLPVVVEPNMGVTIDVKKVKQTGEGLNKQLYRFASISIPESNSLYENDLLASNVNSKILKKIANSNIEYATAALNELYNVTGWQIYADNRDNVVGAYVLNEYYEQFIENGYFYDDTTMQRIRILDSLYAEASPVVKNYKPLKARHQQSLQQKGTSKGKQFIDFEAIDRQTGKAVHLSDIIKGHVAVVDFWASWCSPCREEIIKYLKPLYERYADSGLVVVGVDVWDKPDRYETALRELGMPYPQLTEKENGELGKLHGFSSIPQIFVFDADGTILGNYRGEQIEQVAVEALSRNKQR